MKDEHAKYDYVAVVFASNLLTLEHVELTTCTMMGAFEQIDFTFDEAVSGPLYVYYELENFYQNHRRYVSSRDPNQLYGEVRDYISIITNDKPLLNSIPLYLCL